MTISGGCYCQNIRYEISSEPETAFQCHCRECQYITGGNPNIVMVFPKDSFSYSSGNVTTFSEKIWKRQSRVIFVINAEQQLERRVHLVLIQ